jgi:Glycosyltransferase family 87
VSARQRRLRFIVAVAMVVLAIAALRDLRRLGEAAPWRTMDDFPDFYCAGSALDARASPYTYEPLHTCEHRVNVGNSFRGRLFRGNPNVAVPAPQPPFDFAPFMALARLPFTAARLIDAIAIVASVVLCALTLAGLGVPFELSLAALALSTGYAELNTGQIVPFSLLALVLCGLALARGHDALAGILAPLTAIEPIVGVPAIAAMLLFVPRARAPVVASVLLLAIGSITIVGAPGLLGYFTLVLPAHAGSELHFPFQYSLTYALAYLGVAPPAARLTGEICYGVMLLVGLVLAPRTSAALRRRELLVFSPALCAVIAGPFLHQEELCFALPCILILTIEARGKTRTLAALALCVLSVPWILVWGTKQLFLASLFVCAAIFLRLRIDLRIAFALLCAVAATIYAFELRPPHLPVPPAGALRAYAANELVQNEWREYTEARSTRDALWFVIKLPTWAALLAALGIAARLQLPPASESSPESLRKNPNRPPALRRARTGSSGDRA